MMVVRPVEREKRWMKEMEERVRVKKVEFFLWDPLGQMAVFDWIVKGVYKVV